MGRKTNHIRITKHHNFISGTSQMHCKVQLISDKMFSVVCLSSVTRVFPMQSTYSVSTVSLKTKFEVGPYIGVAYDFAELLFHVTYI